MSVLVFKSFTDAWWNFIRNFNSYVSVWFSINSLSNQARLVYITSIYDDENYQ